MEGRFKKLAGNFKNSGKTKQGEMVSFRDIKL